MKKQKPTDSFQKQTVIFGYTFLASIVVLEIIGAGLLMSRIASNNTGTMQSRFITVVVLMCLSAIVPPLISYLTGEVSTKKKLSTLTHHFNGVLFASTAFLVWLALITVGFNFVVLQDCSFIPARFLQFWPALATITIMIALGIGYAKSKIADSVMSFKPFGTTLLIAIASWVILGLYSQKEILQNTHTLQAFTNNLLPGALSTIIVLGMFLVAYVLRAGRHDTPYNRTVTAGAMTIIGLLALNAIGQLTARFVPDLGPLATSLIAAISGTGIWLFYLRTVNR